MSRKLTRVDKEKFIEESLVKLTDEQKKIVLGTANQDARYDKVRRYLRIQNETQKKERKCLLELATKYRHILDGLDCLDQKLWTDEKKIKAFTKILDEYCEKGVKLVEDNNRKRLENLISRRELCQKKYTDELDRYDKEIKELKETLGDSVNTVTTEVSFIP